MLILFALVVMRMSGAIGFNPVLGRSEYPSSAKAALIFMLSLLLYLGIDSEGIRQPASIIEFGVMLLTELFIGFILGFVMELAFMTVRFATTVMDHAMGLSMAQVYDPQTRTQVSVTSNLYYGFLVMLFFATDGHLWLIRLFYRTADIIPFGMVHLTPQLYWEMLEIFQESIVMGMKFAFPLLAMELVTEAAVGILMRMIPQINVFTVNFQIKIIVGILMLLYLFSPISEQLYVILDSMYQSMENMVQLMGQ